MAERPHIDKKSMKVLKFLYSTGECTLSELFKQFGIKGIQNTLPINNIIIYFIKSRYIGFVDSNNNLIHQFTFDSYFETCMSQGIALLSPKHILFLLPEGKFIVEESRRNFFVFLIPLAISILSALASIASIIISLLNNSPILVKLLE